MACEADALAHPVAGGRPMTVRAGSPTRLLLRPEDVPAVPRRLRGRRRVQPRGGPGRATRSCSWSGWPSGPGSGGRGSPACRGGTRPTGLTVDWVPDAELEPIDPRVVRRKADGLVRLTFTLAPAGRPLRRRAGRAGGHGRHASARRRSVEEFGVEDPRITPLGRPVLLHLRGRLAARPGDGPGVHGRLPHVRAARGHLLPREQGRGPVPGADRRAPTRRCTGRSCGDAVHPAGDVGRAVARPDPLGRARPLHVAGGEWQIRPRRGRVRRRSASPTAGWRSTTATASPTRPGEVGAYYGGALLLDPDDPARVLPADRRSRSSRPRPTSRSAGFVPNVVFPTGVVQDGDTLLVYYGAADAVTAVAEFSLSGSLLDAMIRDAGLIGLTAGSWRRARRRAGRWRTCWRSRTSRRG